jgi:predicted dehydrogenase
MAQYSHQGTVRMRDINWGILGPGFIAGLFAEDLARTPGARCVAVASRDLGRAQTFAKSHDVKRYYGSYDALAQDPEIDIVYVATPHSHHFAHAKLMLEGGKAVLLEKPFTMTAAEASELIAIAKSRKLFLMEAMWTLCNPLMRQLVQRVSSGDIGTPRAFSATLGPIGVPRGHRVEDPALGASYIRECLVYPINILLALSPDLAKADQVFAVANLSDRGVDIGASVSLKSSTGAATMNGGFAMGSSGAGLSAFQLIGDQGWLQVDDNLFNPGRATFSSKSAQPVVLTEPLSAERYRWEIEEAGRCLVAGELESQLVPHHLTIHAMQLIDRARAAANLEKNI